MIIAESWDGGKMNRKIILCLLCIAVLCTTFLKKSEISAFAVENDSDVMSLDEAAKLINERVNSKTDKSKAVNEPYIYPIIPGTPEWEQLDSKDKMMTACQIPSSIVDSMSTEALALSFINHPLLSTNVISYDDYKQGFDTFIADFDAAKELLKRKDFAINLAKIYLDIPVLSIEEYQEQSFESNTIIDFIVLETVLAVPQVFDLFEEDEVQALITVARNKSEEKQKNEKIYGGSYDWFFTVRQAVSGRISRNGFATVFTPRGSSVVITISAKEFTTEEINQINADYKRRYPEATIVAPASRKYNCHS